RRTSRWRWSWSTHDRRLTHERGVRLLGRIDVRHAFHLYRDSGLTHETGLLTDALVRFTHERVDPLVQDEDDGVLMTRPLGVVGGSGGVETTHAIARGPDGEVDLIELVVQAERLDDVLLLARHRELATNHERASVHRRHERLRSRHHLLRRHLV